MSDSSNDRSTTIDIKNTSGNKNSSGFSFAGATITNCYFVNKLVMKNPIKKRRINIIYDSSDEEN